MPIQAVSAQRLYQQVADHIADLIRGGEYAQGSRLPPERDLAKRLQVSRPTVREALIALEIAGLVEVRTGSGAYVCEPGARNHDGLRVALDSAGPGAFELIAARRLVEPPVAALAAQNATPADIESIAEAVALFERRWAGTHHEKLEADRLFHTRLAEATRNAVVTAIVEELWRGMFGPIFAVLSERTQLTNRQSMTLQDHRTILACVERRDAAAAHAAMLNHLVHVELTLLESDAAPAYANGSAAPTTGAGRRAER
jgi:DNA-binding FadR family transcriptional regulator